MTEPRRRRIDRILADDYLAGIRARSLDELRVMRMESAEVETEISYVRRLAQARLDILQAELDRRSAGGSVGDLIAALPEILAGEGGRGSAAGTRLQAQLAPPPEITWSRGLERLVADDTLANLPNLDERDLRSTMAQLRELEADVSVLRRELHRVLDGLDLELGNRLKAAQA